jgi:hypothetical protein
VELMPEPEPAAAVAVAGIFNACRLTLQCPDGTMRPHKRFLGLLLPPTRVTKAKQKKRKTLHIITEDDVDSQ